MSCGLHVLFPVSSATRRTPHVRENLFRCVHSDAGCQRNWFKCQKSISSTHPLDDQDHLKTKMVKGVVYIFRQKCKILFFSRHIEFWGFYSQAATAEVCVNIIHWINVHVLMMTQFGRLLFAEYLSSGGVQTLSFVSCDVWIWLKAVSHLSV